MPTSKTKVINNTGSDVLLKLSTGGVISKLSDGPVKPGGYYNISLDLTTTYREYWCAVQPRSQHKVILSSDDCAQHSEVTLTAEYAPNTADGERVVSRYKWEGTKPRGSAKKAKTAPAQDANGEQRTPATGTSADVVNGVPGVPATGTSADVVNGVPGVPATGTSVDASAAGKSLGATRGKSKCAFM